ncbi:TPA: hypothetical protein ACPUFQ_002478 [Klebsiella pneumoniae]
MSMEKPSLSFLGFLFFKPLQRGVTKASLRAGFGIQTTPATPVISNNAQLAGFKGQLNEVVTMTKAEMIQYLMSRYQVSYRIAQDALSDNDWDLMMAAGDIRDELNAEV